MGRLFLEYKLINNISKFCKMNNIIVILGGLVYFLQFLINEEYNRAFLIYVFFGFQMTSIQVVIQDLFLIRNKLLNYNIINRFILRVRVSLWTTLILSIGFLIFFYFKVQTFEDLEKFIRLGNLLTSFLLASIINIFILENKISNIYNYLKPKEKN